MQIFLVTCLARQVQRNAIHFLKMEIGLHTGSVLRASAMNEFSAGKLCADTATAQEFLEKTLAHFDAQAGSIHLFKQGFLQLAAHANLPPSVVAVIETVPVGKGLAGLAAERREPVQVCNLQTDDSGAARPGARATG